eukprot:GHUV01049508.1.p1 GENE.GHUV01049508.1~~GHUV01049508.1.p1  ORF type:complete len:112 (-),score=3.58 GHUV01049508.1:628-963(-)
MHVPEPQHHSSGQLDSPEMGARRDIVVQGTVTAWESSTVTPHRWHLPDLGPRLLQSPQHINIAMDYASGGSLFTYVQCRNRLREPLARCVFVSKTVPLGPAAALQSPAACD